MAITTLILITEPPVGDLPWGPIQGWFDLDRATNVHVTVDGSMATTTELWRTVGGQWAFHDLTATPDPTWVFVSAQLARDWLILEADYAALAINFGVMPDEAGPGYTLTPTPLYEIAPPDGSG